MNKRTASALLTILTTAGIFYSCNNDTGNPRPLIFYVFGDWGHMSSPNQLVIAFQMNEWTKKENPSFIITTGDNFYEAGVTGVNDPHWQESFEKVYNGENLLRKPWYVSLGNHDYGGNPDAQIAYHSINSRWNMPSRYYSRVETLQDGGRVRLIFIDTSPFEKSYYQTELKDKVALQDTLRQKKWLDSLTSLTDVDWKIVVGHHHLYTGGVRKDDANSVRTSLEPVFSKNLVDIYFCGHEHDLQHLKPDNKPTHYFISGAGSEIRPTSMIPESRFAVSTQGFMSVSIKRKKIEVRVIDYKGNPLYMVELTH